MGVGPYGGVECWEGEEEQPRLGPDVQNLTFSTPFSAEKVTPSYTYTL